LLEKKGLQQGRKPRVVGAGIVYITAKKKGKEISQDEVAKKAKVTEAGLRNFLHYLKDNLGEDFFKENDFKMKKMSDELFLNETQ
jgi:transcription initiation factor TFIIIB Brf1 subunit/transcription initiation factor TFIIB